MDLVNAARDDPATSLETLSTAWEDSVTTQVMDRDGITYWRFLPEEDPDVYASCFLL